MAAQPERSAMWGGRFDAPPDPLFTRFNDSLPFDYRLGRQDVRGSAAWARALGRAGVLTSAEVQKLADALADIDVELVRDPRAPLADNAEDIHSWVESELVASLGDLGKKLHTGRSRNDQVATDLRLWTRDAVMELMIDVRSAQGSLLSLGERDGEIVIPGYTHLQRAQPVLLGHWCLAYLEMLERDYARFSDTSRRMGVCPLGSGALAGTAYTVDRHALAADLGFESASRNSLDAVSDRDFVLDTLSACVTCTIHLTRIAEDLILGSTQEFAFFEQADAVSSGSSLMPQKKNPDALELIRGKCGRIVGAHAAVVTVLKGLPLAYNKDLQEDKEPLFDAVDSMSMCLRMLVRVIDGLRVNREACERAAAGGYSNATDLADYLVMKGMPFREAHEVSGRIVRRAIALGVPIEQMPLAELQAQAPVIEQDVFSAIGIEEGLRKRSCLGATGRDAVRLQLQEARRRHAPH